MQAVADKPLTNHNILGKSKKSVVILHGWGHRGTLWKSLAEKLGKNAIVFDLPGFGDEPLVSPNWGVPEYAEWVRKKIDKNQNTILIGHSFGGRVAAEIAGKNPKWLGGLVLSGAPCIYRPSLGTKIKIRIYKSLKTFLPKNLKALFYTTDLTEAREKGLEKVFRKVVVYDQTDDLRKIKVPVLLIWGENDQVVPLRIAREMNELIRGSNLKIIEGAGHNSYFDNPNLFYGTIAKWLHKTNW